MKADAKINVQSLKQFFAIVCSYVSNDVLISSIVLLKGGSEFYCSSRWVMFYVLHKNIFFQERMVFLNVKLFYAESPI